MNSLKIFNRKSKFFSTISLKKKWQNLSSYITNENDLSSWKELNTKIFEAENLIQKQENESFKKIDWNVWNNKISNKELLSCMKNFYDNQMKMLEELEENEEKEKKTNENEEDIIFDEALKNCKKSEENSEKLLVDGAKTLWISFHNPPVSNLDNNEWIESDKYWQAFVEKHSVYNLNNKSLEPEDEENINFEKNEWHKKTTKFNERSDTPILYDYMINLPSWEYYDINRRIFLEHLFYFLLRTGLSYKHFPELFSWKWQTHIEDLRFQFLDVSQKRRSEIQLLKLKREQALELQPIDYEHNGEEFHLKLLNHLKDYQNLLLSRLMSNYIFLCDPFIPVQTKEALENVLKLHKGKLYKLNNEVNCLFFLPENNDNKTNYKPFEALHNFYQYLQSKNIKLNPSYSELLNIFTEILQERGDYWLNISNENISDSFLRRYNKDDSMYPIFVEYVTQLKEAFSNKIEIPIEIYKKEIEIIEEKYKDECIFFDNFLKAFLSDDITSHEKLPDFIKLDESQIKKLVDEENVEIVDLEKNEKIVEPKKIVEYIKNQEIEKQKIQEFVKSINI
ncbi:conserved protein, unknown function [Plasmodium relictum]|uniref:Uncharacterized protein n=1 Tax=Plasmodium relictum TaxID=85471 RepID=A0A1J1H5I0_PLARL|nr:conserved protein, unknown function [Plasmodium relictum]CRG99811.1 conserved protein, unknown function [Plasmodium relictum]